LANSRTIEQLRSTAQRPGDETGGTATLGRLLIAEKDRDAAQARIETLNHLLERAEARARAEEERAESLAEQARLAQAAAVVPPPTPLTQRDATAAELEQEIHTLRESLMHAEEALAIAAADEQGLSADWVMRALTRYSGELEQAQEQIQTLEQQLEIRGTDSKDQTLLAMLDDLRSPITSIVGYSDLLLGEAMGTLGVNQRKFLQRVRGNVERMRGTIGALSALLRADRLFDAEEDDEITDNVADVVDIAIDTVLEQIQERELRLELDVDDRLPPIPVGKETLHQIIAHLLNNACHVSTRNSRIGLTVHAGTLEGEGSENPLRFLQVTVRDHSVGVQPDMLPYIFNQPSAMETPFVPGLNTAHELVVRSGGRIWIDSRLGDGNTFSVLLPIDGKEPQDSRAVTHVNGNGHAV
jgi:signal transduction histidine kinase